MKNLLLTFLLFIAGTCSIAQNTDIDMLKDINLNRNRKLDNTFVVITHSLGPVSIGVPLGVYCAGLIKHDSTLKNKGAYITTTLLVTAGITFGLKYAIHRPRPYVTYPFIDNVVHEKSPSFPSGHASDAFALATSTSLAFPKWYIVAPSYIWACAVSYSRMDLGVHYPSDVLAGAIIGAGTSYVCYKVNRWLENRKHAN